MQSGLIGAIIGSAIGVLGGALGTYFSIKNTKGPFERAWMIRCAITIWIAVILFLVLLRFVPGSYRIYFWIPYCIALTVSIVKLNRKQAAIRAEENKRLPSEEPL